MSSKALSSDATRRSSQAHVLSPSSDSRLNNVGFAASTAPGKKRKHEASTMEDLLEASIVVKPHPPKISIKPRILKPLMLLPREHLPLSCLDLASPLGEFEYSRHYDSTIKILDLEGRMGDRPVVLIARLETDKSVYALERQGTSLYALCQLGSWVDLEKLSSHATAAFPKRIKPRTNDSANTGHSDASTTPQIHKENKKRRLAIEAIQSLVKKPARSRSVSLPSQEPEITQLPTLVENEVASRVAGPSGPRHTTNVPQVEPRSGVGSILVPATDEALPQATANDIFDNVRNQYFEALYHSMGSLAYFAKGPLSRARAAFHLDCDSNLNMNDLVDFLKSLVLTTIQIDKKYREAVPSIITKMKTHIAESADEQGPRAKKRKSKKIKLGKDGLYQAEDEHVRKWWSAHKPLPKDDDDDPTTATVLQETKLQVSCLRSRETQLQMILVLEILALEPLRSAANLTESQLPGDEPLPEHTNEAAAKKRSKHNFLGLLDVHADRLSIWQSTSLDEIKMLDDSQAGQQREAQKSNSDPLKDFCVDIIVPFFSSRLPERCDSLNRKLGGPVMPSPPKSKPKKAEVSAKPNAKPGAVTKRPAAPKLARTLDRVLSKESERNRRNMSRGPGSMIALMRSASTPIIPMLKRETSEPLCLANVPSRDSKYVSNAKDKASGSSSLASARRTTQEEKAKRDAQVKAELEEAISGLRKPNRGVVGKAMAEAAERRTVTSLSQLRKSRKPTQHLGFQSIVKATPVGPRFRDALARDAHSQPTMSMTYNESTEADHVPPSSLIASSAPRKRDRNTFLVEESSPALPASEAPMGPNNSTPARPSTLTRKFLSVPESTEGMILASSPIASRNFLAIPNSSLRHRDSGFGMPSSPGNGGHVATPVKKGFLGGMGSLEGYVTVTPVKKRVVDHIFATPARPEMDQEKEPHKMMSIYENLGWDDEYDDLA